MTTTLNRSPRTASTRYLIFILVSLLMLTLAGAGFALYRDRQNREAVAAAQLTRLAEQMASRLDRFFGPAAEDLLLIRQWSVNGSLSVSAPERLTAKLAPMIENHSQIHAFMLWEADRLSFILARDGEGLLSGHAQQMDADNPVWVWRSQNADGTVTETWRESAETLDASLDAWQRAPNSSNQEQIVWSHAGSFPPAQRSGLFAATDWRKDKIAYTAAAGVLDAQIVQLLDDIRSGPSYRFFLFSQNGLFIDFQNPGTPSSSSMGNGDPMAARDDPVLSAARQVWLQKSETDTPFGFDYAGDRFYGLAHILPGGRQDNGIGVLAARDDLLRHLPLNRFFFVPVVSGLLWIALLVVVIRMRKLTRRGPAKISLQTMTENELLQLIEQGETDTLEFKSTLRWNLRSGKAGKEIELACLKTVAAFMNTDGGTLLVGVADDGTVTGIAADNFPNDDKYLRHFSAIFEQHIGLNFSEFVEFVLLPAKGASVFAVRCRRSPRPVFVTTKKDEMFFIRSGPSSRQLSTSQAIAYLEERGRQDNG
jgi:hypothetical protein